MSVTVRFTDTNERIAIPADEPAGDGGRRRRGGGRSRGGGYSRSGCCGLCGGPEGQEDGQNETSGERLRAHDVLFR